jgi:hypothetical protein
MKEIEDALRSDSEGETAAPTANPPAVKVEPTVARVVVDDGDVNKEKKLRNLKKKLSTIEALQVQAVE